MPISLSCQSCGRELRVRDDLAGEQIYCPDCKSILTVPAEDESISPYPLAAPAPPAASSAAVPTDDFSIRAEVPPPPPSPPPPFAELDEDSEDKPLLRPTIARTGPNVGAIVGGAAMMGGAVVLIAIFGGLGGKPGAIPIRLVVFLFIAGIVTFIRGLVGSR
jgi:hypothetical protein